jgi:KDO2-lipid IV(A) lauroyltransferase
MLTRLGVGILWVLHFLPQSSVNALAAMLGSIAWRLPMARTAKTNLRLCFPELSDAERTALEKKYFKGIVRSFLELGVVWFASPETIQSRVKLHGLEHYEAVSEGPVIFLAMHALGLEMAGARMGMAFKGVGFFTPHKNALIDHLIRASRDRLGDVVMLDRREGLRPMVRAIREGRRLYFLPDMDFGDKDAIFVPFFGLPAATVTTLPRLVTLTRARVVPVTFWQESWGYSVQFFPAWREDYPSGVLEDDVASMNAYVEAVARARPDQYFWGHKRFKTRPTPEDPYLY